HEQTPIIFESGNIRARTRRTACPQARSTGCIDYKIAIALHREECIGMPPCVRLPCYSAQLTIVELQVPIIRHRKCRIRGVLKALSLQQDSACKERIVNPARVVGKRGA